MLYFVLKCQSRVKTVNFDVCKMAPKLIGYHSDVSSTTAKIISVCQRVEYRSFCPKFVALATFLKE